MGGLFFILGTTFLAVFAYFLIGDSSPNANNQKAEIALKSPNFSTEVIILKNNRFDEDVSILDRFIDGSEKPYDYYPIRNDLFLH